MKIILGGNNKPIENAKEIEFTHDADDCYLIITLDTGDKRKITSYGVKKIEEID